MKRLFILIAIVFGMFNVANAFNDNYGVSVGYSHITSSNEINARNPKDLLTIDTHFSYVYLGVGFMSRTIYSEPYGYNTKYSEDLSTFVVKGGVSIPLFGEYSSTNIILSPYIGIIGYYYDEYYERNYTYYESYDNGYYSHEYYYDEYSKHTVYSDNFDNEFIYGIKVSFVFNNVMVGGNISNKEFGVSLGMNF